MKYVIATGILVLAPLYTLATTNCDHLAQPALSCPPGYSITCNPTGGWHWSCGKDAAGAISLPSSGSSGSAKTQPNETDLDFVTKPADTTISGTRVATSTPASIKSNPLYEDKINTGTNPTHDDEKKGESIAETGEAEKKNESELERARAVLENGVRAAHQAIESVALNHEKITTRVKHEVKLFGVIPVTARATVEIDREDKVKVKFPWWTFLASGKDESLGEQVFTAISNVLKTRHDTVKNSIGNVR